MCPSPWNLGKEGMRREMLASLAANAQRPVCIVTRWAGMTSWCLMAAVWH